MGFLFWQFGAPLVRYGYFYVLFLPLVTFGALYVQCAEIALRRPGEGKRTAGCRARCAGAAGERLTDRSPEHVVLRIQFGLFMMILVAFLLYRGYNLCNMVLELCGQPYYIYQQDYGTYPADTYEVDGVTIYVPTDRGQIGYDKFPSSPIVQDIELRDGTLESGFRKKGGQEG